MISASTLDALLNGPRSADGLRALAELGEQIAASARRRLEGVWQPWIRNELEDELSFGVALERAALDALSTHDDTPRSVNSTAATHWSTP